MFEATYCLPHPSMPSLVKYAFSHSLFSLHNSTPSPAQTHFHHHDQLTSPSHAAYTSIFTDPPTFTSQDFFVPCVMLTEAMESLWTSHAALRSALLVVLYCLCSFVSDCHNPPPSPHTTVSPVQCCLLTSYPLCPLLRCCHHHWLCGGPLLQHWDTQRTEGVLPVCTSEYPVILYSILPRRGSPFVSAPFLSGDRIGVPSH